LAGPEDEPPRLTAELPPGYELDDSLERVDLDVAWHFLSTEAYWWREWRTREMMDRQFYSAWRVVGVYEQSTGRMVGFCRAISDGASIAYLADVFVLAEHRGKGLGEALVRKMIDDGPGSMFRWMLHTRDAHRLYRKFGFQPPDDRYIERPARL
jgi:GNAT superfamily N-acetyltransferase